MYSYFGNTTPVTKKSLALRAAALWILLTLLWNAAALEAVPDKVVALTFDDSVASHYSVVRPILKRYGFGATFFITEGFSFATNKTDYMTWEQIAELHRDGFEIGNHTRDHLGISRQTLGQLEEQIEAINRSCAAHAIPRPVSFAWPGNRFELEALPMLEALGLRFARRGGAPEHPYEWGRGFAYEPGRDHPLLIPSAGDARPDWTIEDFRRAAGQARDARIAVLQFHGVPDRDHPWVHTPPERFEGYMRYLKTNGFTVIALRDLARYVDPAAKPANPQAVIEERQRQRTEVLVEGEITDAAGGGLLPARIYIEGADHTWHFPKTAFTSGSAVRYERRSGFNTNTVEMHTTVSAHPFRVELAPGDYRFTIERGKEYFPESRLVTVAPGLPKLTFRLRRWIDMPKLGWFSGDAHNHRNPAELPNAMLAEDLNVALPMVDWTTVSTLSPAASDRGFRGDFPNAPQQIDATHVWHPRNTEYEIFRTGSADHMLGAFLVLNHQARFEQPVVPLKAVAAKAHAEGALIDLEKHNWPWSLAIVPLLHVDLFELANNHHWRSDYSLQNWAVPAPEWMGLAGGRGNERDWTLYGFQTYYALLNCGFHLRPAAGTANGVHPVPLGFSRVYVHLDGPFTYEKWIAGLGAGNSFVTTGPMLLAHAEGQWPGTTFTTVAPGKAYPLECKVSSEQKLETIELIVNGRAAARFPPENRTTSAGSFESVIRTNFTAVRSSWVAWRCFEPREGNRLRFAHTGPWYFEVGGEPLRARRIEAEWLVKGVEEEIARSRGIAPAELLAEYQAALDIYREILRKAE